MIACGLALAVVAAAVAVRGWCGLGCLAAVGVAVADLSSIMLAGVGCCCC